MYDLVNVLIEINLRILYTTKNYFLYLNDFKGFDGTPLQRPKAFVRLLRIKKLVMNLNEDKNCYHLTEFGKEIYENGGWLQHLKNEKENNKVAMELMKMNKKSLVDFFDS